jgi:ribonuclease VapC
MSQVVLDSSAILALLQQEPGADQVLALVDRAVASSVNAAEVQSKLIRDGMPAHEAKIAFGTSIQTIVPFDESQAETAAALIAQTQAYGLSLGDRACLALALSLNAPVYTTDRAWAQVKIGVEIRLVR